MKDFQRSKSYSLCHLVSLKCKSLSVTTDEAVSILDVPLFSDVKNTEMHGYISDNLELLSTSLREAALKCTVNKNERITRQTQSDRVPYTDTFSLYIEHGVYFHIIWHTTDAKTI